MRLNLPNLCFKCNLDFLLVFCDIIRHDSFDFEDIILSDLYISNHSFEYVSSYVFCVVKSDLFDNFKIIVVSTSTFIIYCGVISQNVVEIDDDNICNTCGVILLNILDNRVGITFRLLVMGSLIDSLRYIYSCLVFASYQ